MHPLGIRLQRLLVTTCEGEEEQFWDQYETGGIQQSQPDLSPKTWNKEKHIPAQAFT